MKSENSCKWAFQNFIYHTLTEDFALCGEAVLVIIFFI